MKGSELLVQALQQEGVRYIFGLPGEETLDLLDAIRKSPINFITCRHEQAAAFMAATYGRLTGEPGVVLSTLGPGATNLLTGIGYAQLGAMPLIAISGQKSLRKREQGNFQLLDLCSLFQPVTKYSTSVESADRVPEVIRNAFRLASSERPGAVYIEFPEDIAKEESEKKPLKRSVVRRPAPDPKAIQDALEMIQLSERPLVMIGSGANRKRISRSLLSFIEATRISFFTTQLGKGVVDERHPKYLGCSAVTEGDILHDAINQSDLIIAIGHDIYEKPPVVINSGKQKVININFCESAINRSFTPDLEVVGDIANSLTILTRIFQRSSNFDEIYFKQFKEKIEKSYLETGFTTPEPFPLKISAFTAMLRSSLGEKSILSLDNGLYKIWIARNYKAYSQNTILLDNTFATMGAGLPAAITTKLLEPDKHVVAVCGDGGFMMNSQELETAVRLNLDLTLIVLRDDSYGMIKWKQKLEGYPEFGTDYNNPDFVKYAESYGARGFRPADSSQLKEILGQSARIAGVTLIEVPIDYSESIF